MTSKKPELDEMAEEYDFSQGERGRFAKQLEDGYDIVVDGHEQQSTHVSGEEVRAARMVLEARRRRRRVAERP